MTAKQDSITYYVADNSDTIYACRGTQGLGGIFRLERSEKGAVWVHLDSQSDAWDSVHQAIYQASRADRLEDRTTIAALPPVPPTPTEPSPAERLRRATVFPVAELPRVAARVTASGGALLVHVVLAEDTYETLYGDGCFRYLEGACTTAREADAIGAHVAQVSPGTKIHRRTLRVHLQGSELQVSDMEVFTFDRHTARQVLDLLESDRSFIPEP